MAVAVGQRCVVRIQITDINLRNAREIMATIVSPQGDEKCQDISFDEVSGLVYATVDVNSAGNWYMWLCVRFANEVLYTPSFVFAEVEGDAKPCDAPYIVDVEVQGESVTVTPPKVDVDAVTREEFERLSKEVAGKVDKVDGKVLSTNDYTDADKAEVEKIKNKADSSAVEQLKTDTANSLQKKADKSELSNKQDTLTLTTKPNGNIVIGNLVIGNLAGQSKEFMPATPSGDPMHYIYEAVGAVYNATNADITSIGQYGETITHKAGHWLLNEIGDIDNEEMRLIYSSRYPSSSGNQLAGWFGAYPYRTNLMKVNWQSGHDINSVLGNAYKIEVFNMGNAIVNSVTYSFYSAYQLYKVLNIINSQNISSFTTNTFKSCGALQHIRLKNLKVNAFFQDSPLLSKESLLYMINNCASNVTFTITLHNEVYAKCQEGGEWYSEVNTALSAALSDKTTTITIASA